MTTHEISNKHFAGEDNKCQTGGVYELTSTDPTLKRLVVATGWDFIKPGEDAADLDLSAFLLDKNHMTREDEDFVFYNQTSAQDDCVVYGGDNRTGAGEGDDESIYINIKKIPFDIYKVLFVISIYKGYEKQQDFKMVKRSFLRLMNPDSNREYLRYDLDSIFAKSSNKHHAIKVGALVREGEHWKFEAYGELIESELGKIAEEYGLIIKEQ